MTQLLPEQLHRNQQFLQRAFVLLGGAAGTAYYISIWY
jgi:hypothetical protein